MMALPLRVLRYKSVMQSETRSLRAIWSRVKSGTGSPWATWSAQPWRLVWTGSKQAQRGGALGERQWRSTVDMSARRELLERIENESKAYGSDFGSQNLPTWQECATAVRSLCSQYELLSFSLCHYRASTLTWQEMCNSQQLYTHCALNRCFYPFHWTCHYRASTTLRGLICAHPTSTLRCHWDCGAHDSFQGVVPMLSIASQCIHVTISLPLDLFYPVTLFLSERRPAALVLSILKGASRFCA